MEARKELKIIVCGDHIYGEPFSVPFTEFENEGRWIRLKMDIDDNIFQSQYSTPSFLSFNSQQLPIIEIIGMPNSPPN